MTAPARKPSRMLLVARATAKPPIAQRRIFPFIDRLVTPGALADRLSDHPEEDRRRGGEDARKADEDDVQRHRLTPLPARRWRSPCASRTKSTSVPWRTPARDESCLSTMGSWMLPTFSAAKNSATGAATRRVVSCQHRHHQPEVAVAAGDRRNEPVIHRGDLHGPGEPGENAAQREGDHHVLPGGDAQQVGGVRVLSHRLQAQPEMRPLEQHVHEQRSRGPRSRGPTGSAGTARRAWAARATGRRARSRTSKPPPGASTGRR